MSIQLVAKGTISVCFTGSYSETGSNAVLYMNNEYIYKPLQKL